jgi:D-amino peptidase
MVGRAGCRTVNLKAAIVRIYLSADMEGITGLVDAIDVQPGGADYERGRVMMTEDVNAAVRGALAAGATAVTVNDAHGPMRNLLPDLIHPAVSLIRGRPKPMGMLEGLSPDFDAAVFIGYHARAGTLGVLSHSFMGHEIEDMWLDDRPAGEIGLTHATAAAFGVPVVAMSGDDTACAEMAAWDRGVTAVAVKQARDRFAALLLPVAQAREAIEQSVAAAVRARADAGRPPAETGSRTLAIRWQSATAASQLDGIPGVKLRDSRTTVVTGAMPDLFRLLGVFMRAAVAMAGQGPYC